jgi:hypothetical protein
MALFDNILALGHIDNKRFPRAIVRVSWPASIAGCRQRHKLRFGGTAARIQLPAMRLAQDVACVARTLPWGWNRP